LPELPGAPTGPSLAPAPGSYGADLNTQPLPEILTAPGIGGDALLPGSSSAAVTDKSYRVAKFIFRYCPDGKKLNPKLPPIQKLTSLRVKLPGAAPAKKGKKDDGIPISQLTQEQSYQASTIQQIFETVSKELNHEGIYGVLVVADPNDLDPDSGQDLRNGKTDLNVQVYASEVKEIRTISHRGGPNDRVVNDPRDRWIAAHSPLKGVIKDAKGAPVSPGSLLYKDALQDYLSRLNRFSGRRVDSAINASGEPGEIIVDYIVRETKPISVYAEVSNSGTKSTGDIYGRLGIIYRNLIPMDSLLNLEIGSSFDGNSRSVSGSYQQAVLLPNLLTAKIYGSLGDFTAKDVGQDLQNFKGSNETAGIRFTLAPFQIKDVPIDFFAGVEWRHISVTNNTFPQVGDSTFLLPNIGVDTIVTTDKYSFNGVAMIETNLPDIAPTDASTLSRLGRFNTNANFTIASGQFKATAFLEPLLSGSSWDEGKYWKKSTLAHEIAFSGHGQYTFNNGRLVPQFEELIGGFTSVRGYPESISAGDSGLAGSIEYRLHLPRLLKPLDAIAQDKASSTPGSSAGTAPASTASDTAPAKDSFLFRPQSVGSSPYGKPDWDLILRGFVDAGATFNNHPQFGENDHTLLGAGVGLELQIKRYINFRVDWGTALLPVTISPTNQIKRGYNRFHFVLSLAW